MTHPIALHRANDVEYAPALEWQRATADAVLSSRDRAPEGSGATAEALAVIQHTPVFTVGARGGREHLLADLATLEARGAAVVDTDRGGDITFHGPGQLVAYPILDLRRRGVAAADYVRLLEQTVIDTLATFGVHGERVIGRPGVWVPVASIGAPEADSVGLTGIGQTAGMAKIAAIGVRVQRGVSRHGLALNVDPDLGWFDAIVPCGIADASVTSLARELGDGAPPFEAVVDAFRRAFERRFDATLVEVGETPLATGATSRMGAA